MDRGKLFDRALQVFIALCAATGSYFTIYPSRQIEHIAAQSERGALMSAAPWWALSLLVMSVILLLATLGRTILERRRARLNVHGRMFPIETGVYIGQITIGIDKLASDLFLEIGMTAYNGTTKFVSLSGIQGCVVYEGKRLPEPKLILDANRTPFQNLPAAKEFLIILEQRVPKDIAEGIMQKLNEKNEKQRVLFDLSKLDIFAFFPPNMQSTTRLPIWNGLTIDIEGKFPCSRRAIFLSANIKL